MRTRCDLNKEVSDAESAHSIHSKVVHTRLDILLRYLSRKSRPHLWCRANEVILVTLHK